MRHRPLNRRRIGLRANDVRFVGKPDVIRASQAVHDITVSLSRVSLHIGARKIVVLPEEIADPLGCLVSPAAKLMTYASPRMKGGIKTSLCHNCARKKQPISPRANCLYPQKVITGCLPEPRAAA